MMIFVIFIKKITAPPVFIFSKKKLETGKTRERNGYIKGDIIVENKPNAAYVKISKFLSLVLRHSPETIHLNMDKNGWVNIDELIANADKYKNIRLNSGLIRIIVENNDKQRFAISDDGKRIRANQGHSIIVDLELESKTPPGILYHGTAVHSLDSIMKEGLKPMSRQFVHLSPAEEIALTVGKRHGKPVVLYIDTKNMQKDGYKFYLSKNNVWLVNHVPAKYINAPSLHD
jgi:putative RNA 2'-phosphotransferase